MGLLLPHSARRAWRVLVCAALLGWGPPLPGAAREGVADHGTGVRATSLPRIRPVPPPTLRARALRFTSPETAERLDSQTAVWSQAFALGPSTFDLEPDPSDTDGSWPMARGTPELPVQWEYEVRHWAKADGLPHDKIRSLLQARDGSLWLGTAGGLVRFRGERFEVFDEDNTAVMRGIGSVVRTMVEDRDGRLWFATESGLMSWREGVFSREHAEIEWGRINAVVLARAGGIWVVADEKVARCAEGRVEWLKVPELRRVTSLMEGEDGRLWIGGSGGVVGYDLFREGAPLRYLERVDAAGVGSTTVVVRGLMLDRRGVLWMGTNHGVWRVIPGAGDPERLTGWQPARLGAPQNARFVEDPRGAVWISDDSVDGGVWCLEPEGPDFLQTRLEARMEHAAALTVDSRGAIWVAAREGLFRVVRKPFRTLTASGWFGALPPFSAVVSDVGEGLWFAGPLMVARWQSNTLWCLRLWDRHNIPNALLLPLDVDRLVLVGESGRARLISADGVDTAHWEESVPGLARVGAVGAVCRGSAGDWYLGGTNGLHRLDRRGSCELLLGAYEGGITALALDGEGRVWAGVGGKGLGVLHDRRMDWVAEEAAVGRVTAMAAGRSGMVWVGTTTGLRGVRGRSIAEVRVEGFEGGGLGGVLEDRRGDVWLNLSTGLLRLQREHLGGVTNGVSGEVVATRYGRADGIGGGDAAVGSQSIVEAADGRLWFARRAGVVVVNPAELTRDDGPSSVRCGDAGFDDTSFGPVGTRDAVVRRGGTVWFRFEADGAPAVEPPMIQYRLEGSDAAWRDAGALREVRYAGLGAGEYRFRMRTRTRDSRWSDAGEGWRVAVVLPFWRTPWFGFLMVGTVAAAIAGAWWRREMSIRRGLERRKEEALARERARIARDMHDHLGPRIASLSMESEGLEPARAHAEARETLRELNEVIWAVSPEHDTLAALADFIAGFASRYLGAAGLSADLQIAPGLPEVAVPAEVRRELAGMFKESLRNVVQHAGARRVSVRLELEAGVIVLEVRDDGRGFDAQAPGSGTTRRDEGGMASFARRMRALGGECRVTSSPGCGVNVLFRWPLSGTG